MLLASRSCGGVEIDGGVCEGTKNVEARKGARDSYKDSTGTVHVHAEVTKELSKGSTEIRPAHCRYTFNSSRSCVVIDCVE
jgi:hypothetical protein